jgi:hypothetical protein
MQSQIAKQQPSVYFDCPKPEKVPDVPEPVCTWGPPTAPTRIVLVGDSVAERYARSLVDLALNSGGRIQFHTEVSGGCPFTNDQVVTATEYMVACAALKQHAVDYINESKPTVVVISNMYMGYHRIGVKQAMTADEWVNSVQQMVDKIRNSTNKIVWLSAPPMDKNIQDCYGNRSNGPADCISRVPNRWLSMAATEQRLAESVGGVWVDSRPWFCSKDGLCPSFVGSTATKSDVDHMTVAYGEKIFPVMDESLRAAGVY